MVLTCQQTIWPSQDKESNMSKNPQKRCHRNSNVSMTRLSNSSSKKSRCTITRMNPAGLYKSGSCPQNTVPSSTWAHTTYLIQTEKTAAMEEHIQFSHAVTITVLPCQHNLRASSQPLTPLCSTGFFFW